jgi:hypothetical protein
MVFPRTTGSPEWIVMSKEARNVSMAVNQGKLRGAAAYDHGAWDGCADACTGWLFSPLADGIFHARLEDTNDLAVIARDMAAAVVACGLFHSMSGSEFDAVLEANPIPPSTGLAELKQGLQVEPLVSDDPAWVFEPR